MTHGHLAALRMTGCQCIRDDDDPQVAEMCGTAQTQCHLPENTVWTIYSWSVNMTLSLTPLVSLVAGILILVVPRLLNYIVAVYLIVIGILGLVGDVHFR